MIISGLSFSMNPNKITFSKYQVLENPLLINSNSKNRSCSLIFKNLIIFENVILIRDSFERISQI